MRTFTEAERKAGQIARQAKRRAMIAATQHYKLDWLDEGNWVVLASERGIRLPPSYVPPTEALLKKWARKLSKTPFSEHFGCSPSELIRKNPRVPLRTFVGQMLEP